MSVIRNILPRDVPFAKQIDPDVDTSGAPGAVDRTSEFPGSPVEGMAAPQLSPSLFGDTYPHDSAQSRVVAFVSSFCDGQRDEADLERIRAEVRGLGATVLVLSTKASWCFGPDDRLYKRVSPSNARDEALAAAFENFGVPVSGGRDALCGVFVIDNSETIRFAHVAIALPLTSPVRPSQELLLRALVIATEAIETAQRGRRPWPADVTTAGLMAGFKQVTGSTHAAQGRPRREEPLTAPLFPW
jgi:hypothetical protein